MKKKMLIGSVVAVALCAAAITGYFILKPEANPYEGLDFKEYVKVGQYEGLKYNLPSVNITDAEIDGYIKNQLDKLTSYDEVKEGVVEKGDTITIGYVGTIDGKPFKGGSTDAQDVIIGQTQMIDGFIEGLIGKKIGETVDLNLKFPKDYFSKEVAGKDVLFKVNIKAKKVKKKSELNENTIKQLSNGKATNVEQFRVVVKDLLKTSKEKEERYNVENQLWDSVLSKSEVIKYPKAALQAAHKEVDKWEEDYKKQATQNGVKWEDFLKNQLKIDQKKFDETKETYAKNLVKGNLVLYAIANKEHLSISDKEFDKELNKLMTEAGYTDKTFKEAYHMDIKKYAEENKIRSRMLLKKVTDFILEKGVNEAK